MASSVEFLNSSLEGARLRTREINALVTLYGNTAVASLDGSTDVTSVKIYVEKTGQPTPVDSGATFGTLDSNAAPSTIGLLVLTGETVATGNALRVVDIRVPTPTIVSAQMTAGVVTMAGASTTGVTASGNLAAVISCTGLDFDSAIANHTFNVLITYICNPANAS